VLIWAFVDDFLVHSPALKSVEEALRLFLDSAVDHGLLVHPKKLLPPAQEVKYCGFLFNTVSTPFHPLSENPKARTGPGFDHL